MSQGTHTYKWERENEKKLEKNTHKTLNESENTDEKESTLQGKTNTNRYVWVWTLYYGV